MRVILLLQADTLTGLKSQESTIRRILGLPGVAGFSLRVPGSTLNPTPSTWDMATFDHAGAIAKEFGAELQTRTMGGRWAPSHVIMDPRNHYMVWPTNPTTQGIKLPAGTKVPLCFLPDGTRNTFWFNWCIRAMRKLTEWASGREDVVVQHGFWSGLTWAEIAIVREMERYPGFSYDVIEKFHLDLMEALWNLWPGDVEFALSGHAKDYPQIFRTLLAEAKTSPRYVINRNDIGTAPIHEMNFGSIQDPPRHGFQMWGQQPDYDWVKVLDEADGLGQSDGADYLEVYPGNFGTASNPSGLVAEVERRYGKKPTKLTHVVVVSSPTLPPAEVSEDDVPPVGWRNPHGIWAIREEQDKSLSSGDASIIRTALGYEGVVGYGHRFGANLLLSSANATPDTFFLEDRIDVAVAMGKAFKPRFELGKYMPVDARGGRSFTDQNGTGPIPWMKDGTPNAAFDDYYEAVVTALVDLAKVESSIKMIDLSWSSLNYSELYFGPGLQTADGLSRTTNETRFIAACKRMMDIAWRACSPAGIPPGVGLSGHGPITNAALALADYAVTLGGGQFRVQANGLGPNGQWGNVLEPELDRVWQRDTLFGLQDIHPANGGARSAADWGKIDAIVKGTPADYVEYYTDQFGTRWNVDAAALTAFRAHVAGF